MVVYLKVEFENSLRVGSACILSNQNVAFFNFVASESIFLTFRQAKILLNSAQRMKTIMKAYGNRSHGFHGFVADTQER